MARNSCLWYPEINGKRSKLYDELMTSIKNRPQVNWIYASYTASNAADAMDQAGYKRNSQGQHNAADLKKFINYAAMQNEIGTLFSEELRLGFVNNNGQRVDFQSAKEALEKADAFNDSHNALVATVNRHGDNYNVIVAEKDSNTHMRPTEIKKKLKAWEIEKQAFNNIGVDIENLPQEVRDVMNPYQTDIVQYLRNLQNSQINFMYKKQALLLFSLYANSPQVQRLVGNTAFQSLEDAAQAIDDINHGIPGVATPTQMRLLLNAINFSKQFQGIDLNALQSQVDQVTQQIVNATPEELIRQELHRLNKKYKIGINEIHRISDKIDTLSAAAAEAVVLLNRQIAEIERNKENSAEGKRLSGILNQLLNEIANKRYYAGTINFLKEAATRINEVDNILNNMPQTGTKLEIAYGRAKALQDIKSLKKQYYTLLSALADNHLTIDESIAQTDIDNIRQMAKDLKDIFDKKEKVINSFTESNMIDLLTILIGDTAPDGQPIVNVIRMAQVDSTIYDWLYSVGRASNPIIAAMGTVIRNAQDSRDAILNNIARQIRRAENELQKNGETSEFMYEDEEHIISDIDWLLYNQAKETERKSLYKQGYRDWDLKIAMERWEENNTEDRIVDHNNGRTERVPNQLYRKPFPQLNAAQQKYYDIVMQLKGEIGSLLPAYAQKQYLVPQVRRSMLDAINDAKDAKDVFKAIKNKFGDIYKIRENDEDFAQNGIIIDGEKYLATQGDYDNTALRQIPIFFVNRVEQGELLKDFSTGLQALAGTAVNYDAMSYIAQVVEFIGDYAKDQMSRDEVPGADYIENKSIRVFKDLWSWGKKNSNTAGLIDGYIAQHLYGQRLDPHQAGYKWAKFVKSLIGYTSFKGLATNVKGAMSNYLVGEYQMMLEALTGEFYGVKDYIRAHTLLFGNAGVPGEITDLLTNNINSKAVLFREMFDPLNENFSDKSHTRYYHSMFRQLVSHDCSFIGYASGEYLIHYVNMYGVLNNQKVLLNGKKIALYDAFEKTQKQDGNSELVLRQGVTTLDGNTITEEWLDKVRKKIRYCNQTTHGSMNTEDKGLIHQKLWGRAIMNFRQWMVEHYSRRFRGRHFDATLGENREGYWVSYWKYLWNDETKEDWKNGKKLNVIGTTVGEGLSMVLPWFMRDYMTFMLRAQSQWDNLTEDQRYNVKRVHSEMMMYIALLGFSFALGEPDRHKKEFWRRWWIYQVKRMLLDTEASMPHPKAISNVMTIINSPMAGLNTMNSLLYTFAYGPFNGDLIGENSVIKSGPHKGENRYWRNVMKYSLPFFKDWEQMQKLSEDDAIFQVFKDTPRNN